MAGNARFRHEFDNGRSWFVCLGAFIVISLVIAWVRVSGLIFVEIQIMTGASTADVSWVMGANSITFHFLAPVSAVLANKFGTRPVVVVGCLITTISMSFGYFIRQLHHFIVMGLFIGVGSGLCLTPSYVFLSYYFRRRFGIASGVTASGSSVTQIVMSPICTLLLNQYGLPGTLLIFGGISLNLLVSAALFFPVDQDELKAADKLYKSSLQAKEKQVELKKVVDADATSENDADEILPSRKGSDVKASFKEDADVDAQLHEDEDVEEPLHEGADAIVPSQENENVLFASTASMASLPKTKKRIVQRLLCSGNLWMLMIAYSFGSMTSMALVKYGPPYGLEHRMTMAYMGFFLSLSGIPGILVRIIVGLVADLKIVKHVIHRYRLWTVGIILTALSCFLMLALTSYAGFLINFLLMGVSSGLFYTLHSVSAFDLLGPDYGIGFGLMNFFSGLVFLLDSLAVARLRDVTGRFDASFIFCGCLGVAVSVIMLIGVPLIQKRSDHANKQMGNKSKTHEPS